MNKHLQHILNRLQQIEHLSEEQKTSLTESLMKADKEMTITEFKLDRTEKVKRTTAILLEETIEELELKRKAVEESNRALQKSLQDLAAAQDQLVQQEKLASLGQLTAGIAHEIKNPLNFVTNFSDVSLELIDEVREEIMREISAIKPDSRSTHLDEGKNGNALKDHDAKSSYAFDPDLIFEILDDIKGNLRKIHDHGSRADEIVKSMLQHSRGSNGKMEPTDLNVLVKEYVNLAYHGMRAGTDPIIVDIDLKLDASIGELPLISKDFSRVILNLCNNAFDAMREKVSEKVDSYIPKLTVRTNSEESSVSIEIEDNGTGIPEDIRNNILQPFFTTKKGTNGTGLGLSITNDIIKAHGGSMDIVSTLGKSTTFTIHLEKRG